MKRVSTILGLFALTILFALVPWGCSDDDTPTDVGEPDTTPPAVVSVTALDATNIEVVFSEEVEKSSAENSENYVFIEAPAPPPPPNNLLPGALGDTLILATSVLGGDGRTVTNTLWDPMNGEPYSYEISGVLDLSGNVIGDSANGMFVGSTDPDQTPPTIVSHAPADGATGVSIGQSVVIEFSEAMRSWTVDLAFTWTGGGGQVTYHFDAQSASVYGFRPEPLLQRDTEYTITVSGSAMDLAGNQLTQTSWNFRTTASSDNTAPRLVSTTPADGATDVDVSTNLVLEFSEAIDRNSLEEIIVTPEIGYGVDSWSPDGTTITFDPYDDLGVDTMYVMVIAEGSITDLSGNGIEESIVIRWTTAPSLESGQISGRLAGDPGTGAANPAGSVVIISSIFMFDYEEMGPPPIEGAAIAGSGGNYSVPNLIDGTFWPVAMKETNGDGELDPDLGDAVGAYGADIGDGDFDVDSVVIAEGSHESGIDFPLFDPSAIAGELSYNGTMYENTWWNYDYYVGLFDRDPSGGGVDPIGGTGPEDNNIYHDYVLNQLEIGFAPGTYYVGAFLDVNQNGDHDPASEPGGYYMDGGSIGTVTIADGSDVFGVDIEMFDPAGMAAPPAGWRLPTRNPALEARAQKWRQLVDYLKQATEPKH